MRYGFLFWESAKAAALSQLTLRRIIGNAIFGFIFVLTTRLLDIELSPKIFALMFVVVVSDNLIDGLTEQPKEQK